MEENKITSFVIANKDKLPNNKIVYLKEKLTRANDSSFDALMATDLKSPITGLILSLFLGTLGIDRFYAGDVTKGILKLLTFGGCGIWAIIDLFLIMGYIKDKNYNDIMINL